MANGSDGDSLINQLGLDQLLQKSILLRLGHCLELVVGVYVRLGNQHIHSFGRLTLRSEPLAERPRHRSEEDKKKTQPKRYWGTIRK